MSVAAQPSILFFTSATNTHEDFLPLYSYFTSIFNIEAKFEFIVTDSDFIENKYLAVLDFLRNQLGISITVRQPVDFGDQVFMQNSLRFVETPLQKADYVYIGDVDIFILENVFNVHKAVFDANLPYSNVIRPDSQKLTGLHFTKYDSYYPIPNIEDLVRKFRNDEELLFQIVKRAGQMGDHENIIKCGVGRPQHGIHMSLNRIPFSDPKNRLHWGYNQWQFVEKLTYAMDKPYFNEFTNLLPKGARLYLANIILLNKGAISVGRKEFSRLVSLS